MKFCKLEDRVSRRPIDGFAAMSDTTRGGVAGGAAGGAIDCPPQWPSGELVHVRELMGLTSPWYFNAVPRNDVARYAEAWRQLRDPRGFGARWGPTTTERRHKCFNFTNRAQCNWK